MTKLSHSNFQLHRFLTEDGAFIHTHYPESWEDDGDGESGPHLSGGPAYDEYAGESHILFVDASGLVQHSEVIDWYWFNWCEQMEREHCTEEEIAAARESYVKPRMTGEDWQVTVRDEDGRWWSHRRTGWSSSRLDGSFYTFMEACQIAGAYLKKNRERIGTESGKAIVVHADECPRCFSRRIADSSLKCGICGAAIEKVGA